MINITETIGASSLLFFKKKKGKYKLGFSGELNSIIIGEGLQLSNGAMICMHKGPKFSPRWHLPSGESCCVRDPCVETLGNCCPLEQTRAVQCRARQTLDLILYKEASYVPIAFRCLSTHPAVSLGIEKPLCDRSGLFAADLWSVFPFWPFSGFLARPAVVTAGCETGSSRTRFHACSLCACSGFKHSLARNLPSLITASL